MVLRVMIYIAGSRNIHVAHNYVSDCPKLYLSVIVYAVSSSELAVPFQVGLFVTEALPLLMLYFDVEICKSQNEGLVSITVK